MNKSSINEKIAKEFLMDSKDFLIRYKTLEQVSLSSHIGMRSKLLLDLQFSVECSLKAMIFIESKDDEKITYKRAWGHNLSNLLKEISEKERKNCIRFIDKKLFNYNIGNRYNVETYKTYRQSGSLSEEYYSTISNYKWLNKVYNQVIELEKYIWEKITIKIEEMNFGELDIDDMIKEHEKIINLGLKK